MTCVSSDYAKAVEPPSLAASGSASDYRQISHDSYDYPLKSCVGRRQGLGAHRCARRFGLQLFAALRENLFAMFDRERPDREHRVCNRRRQRSAERIDARLIVLPQLELVINRGTAALPDFGVDQVDGQARVGGVPPQRGVRRFGG